MDNELLTVTKCQQLLKWLSGQEPPANLGDTGGVDSVPGSEDPWRRAWQPLQCSCLENPMDRASLVGYSPWGQRASMHEQLPPYFFFFLTHFAPTPFFKGKA